MTFELTITYFMDYYLVKKGTILPLPSFGQCSKENILHEDRGVPQERKNWLKKELNFVALNIFFF